LIWYTNDNDGVVLDEERLSLFTDRDGATSYAEKQEISLEADEYTYDLTNMPSLIAGIESPDNCRALIDAWHLFSDVAGSLSVPFLGDSNDGVIIDIYNKLFYGINMPILKNEVYRPDFDEEEAERCQAVFLSGFEIIDKQLELANRM
jgi:hypothetical protein